MAAPAAFALNRSSYCSDFCLWKLRPLVEFAARLSQHQCGPGDGTCGEASGCPVTGILRILWSLSALPPETGFAVTAISRTPGVTYSDSFDLQCIIKPHYPARVPVSVTWRFQPVGTLEFHDLVTFTRDGGIQWGDRSSSFRTRTAIEKAESSNNVRLSISRASDTEAGKYQCVAELWRRNYNNTWTRLAERTSNLLEIRVLQPDSSPVILVTVGVEEGPLSPVGR
ncbi:immunoglobulin superfamily member 3 [Leptonychotes weddellii]|uniref:immunoglobulin superfamily member 3 n=1 Tax=Leptonychotes weddellii TaxID=9713 RepID=UPI00123E6C8D|nr:immunoglobulin superfamily member 3 [Leptonychotes weddellii]